MSEQSVNDADAATAQETPSPACPGAPDDAENTALCAETSAGRHSDNAENNSSDADIPPNGGGDNVGELNSENDKPNEENAQSGRSDDAECDAGDAGDAGEDARLSALDAAPESRRRVSVILAAVVLLFAAMIAVVFGFPPLSDVGNSRDADRYRILTDEIKIESLPDGADAFPFYKPPAESPLVYRLGLRQEAVYPGNASTRVELAADVGMQMPKRSLADGVTIRLGDVSARVFDGDAEVKLPDSGRMLAGVSLYARFLPQTGLTNVMPDANINPQVARVLFIVSDVLHSAWIPLPDRIAQGMTWTFADKADAVSDPAYRRFASVRVDAWDAQTKRCKLSGHVGFSGGDAVGPANFEIDLEDGKLIRASGEFRRDVADSGAGAARFGVKFEITAKDGEIPAAEK